MDVLSHCFGTDLIIFTSPAMQLSHMEFREISRTASQPMQSRSGSDKVTQLAYIYELCARLISAFPVIRNPKYVVLLMFTHSSSFVCSEFGLDCHVT